MDGMNYVFFRLINTKEIFFFIFACWLLPEKFGFFPKKMMILPESGGCSRPGSYA